MDIVADDADARTERLARILFTRGLRAFERDVILHAPVLRRPGLLTGPGGPTLLLDLFPEGLPEEWLTEALDARWARWYTERSRGR